MGSILSRVWAMVMALLYKFSFHRRLFIYFIVFSFSFLFCFLAFQYHKEKIYKVDQLSARLENINTEVGFVFREGGDVRSVIRQHDSNEFKGMRITIVDLKGRVIYDSKRPANLLPNHSDRPEIKQAIATGEGRSISRVSATTKIDYFYLAERTNGIIVRSALPYTMTLEEVLRVDRNFIWLMCAVAIFIAFTSFLITRRLGLNIEHLREFAAKAEKGEKIDNIEPFKKDELGDVSNAIVRLYIQLRQAKDALINEHNLVIHQEQEQIRIKRQLTQNINHELKTPVSSIEGYLETIINNPQLDEAKKNEFISKCYAQVIRMSNLLGDISTITRMDEAGKMIEKEKLSLSNLIHDVFEEMTQKIQDKGIAVQFDFPDDMFIIGSPSYLQSIFRNLLDNAIAYSGCNKIAVRLLEHSGDLLVFSFADNGVGIEEEHLTRIFERFYRIDKGRSRKLGGTGLGLSIVKNAVLLHGGTIVARPYEGGGLEFVFSIKECS